MLTIARSAVWFRKWHLDATRRDIQSHRALFAWGLRNDATSGKTVRTRNFFFSETISIDKTRVVVVRIKNGRWNDNVHSVSIWLYYCIAKCYWASWLHNKETQRHWWHWNLPTKQYARRMQGASQQFDKSTIETISWPRQAEEALDLSLSKYGRSSKSLVTTRLRFRIFPRQINDGGKKK